MHTQALRSTPGPSLEEVGLTSEERSSESQSEFFFLPDGGQEQIDLGRIRDWFSLALFPLCQQYQWRRWFTAANVPEVRFFSCFVQG